MSEYFRPGQSICSTPFNQIGFFSNLLQHKLQATALRIGSVTVMKAHGILGCDRQRPRVGGRTLQETTQLERHAPRRLDVKVGKWANKNSSNFEPKSRTIPHLTSSQLSEFHKIKHKKPKHLSLHVNHIISLKQPKRRS